MGYGIIEKREQASEYMYMAKAAAELERGKDYEGAENMWEIAAKAAQNQINKQFAYNRKDFCNMAKVKLRVPTALPAM